MKALWRGVPRQMHDCEVGRDARHSLESFAASHGASERERLVPNLTPSYAWWAVVGALATTGG